MENKNRQIVEKRERGKDTDGTKIATVLASLFSDSLTMLSTYTLAFHHSNNMWAITISLPLTCKDTVQLTLHYKALQGSKKALHSPECFQCCRGGQKSGCLSLCSVAHSLSKWRQSPSSFPFPSFLVSFHLSVYPWGTAKCQSMSLLLLSSVRPMNILASDTFKTYSHLLSLSHTVKYIIFSQLWNWYWFMHALSLWEDLVHIRQGIPWTRTHRLTQPNPLSLIYPLALVWGSPSLPALSKSDNEGLRRGHCGSRPPKHTGM